MKKMVFVIPMVLSLFSNMSNSFAQQTEKLSISYDKKTKLTSYCREYFMYANSTQTTSDCMVGVYDSRANFRIDHLEQDGMLRQAMVSEGELTQLCKTHEFSSVYFIKSAEITKDQYYDSAELITLRTGDGKLFPLTDVMCFK